MKFIRAIAWKLSIFLYTQFLRCIGGVWVIGRFYASWIEYQKSDHYRIRTTLISFEYAFETFFKSKFEQNYLLEQRLKKEPLLKWQLRFVPWTVPIPAVLQTAANEGFFKK